jgi:signal transduction histidine kinase
MATAVDYPRAARVKAPSDPPEVRAYCGAICLLFLVCLVVGLAVDGLPPADVRIAGLIFTLAALAADLLMVRFNQQLSFSLSLPIVLAGAMVLPPVTAAVVGFLSTADISDLAGRLPILRALFNRAQIGLSTLAASLVFQTLGGPTADWPAFIAPAVAAVGVDAAVNTAFVAWPVARLRKTSCMDVLHDMFGPRFRDSMLRYVAIGLMAPIIATLWIATGVWGLLAFLIPVGLAWSASSSARMLARASEELNSKNEALAKSLDLMADERRDERLALSGDLHDEVLPALFKVHLMGQVIKKDLAAGQLLQLEEDVPELDEAVGLAQLSIRQTISNLRNSAVGPNGLARAIELCAKSLEAVSSARFSLSLETVSSTSATQLLVFHVAREAMRNAASHSKSESISVRVWQEDGCVRLVVRDEGVGFDPRPGQTLLHFGLTLMAERAEALGGRVVIDSSLGGGTTISLSVPPDG